MADFATKTGTGGTVVPNTYDSTPALTDRVPLTGKKEATITDVVTTAVTDTNTAAAIGAGATFLPSGTGAVATTIQDKLRQFKTAADYGTVQQLINTGARNIDLAGGTYTVTSAILFNQNDQKVSNGTLVFNGSTSARLAEITGDRVTFENVTFSGNSKQPRSGLVYVDSSTDRPVFKDCVFKDITSTTHGSSPLNQTYALLINPYAVTNFEVIDCIFKDIVKYNDNATNVPPAQVEGIGFVGGICFLPEDLSVPTDAQPTPTSGVVRGCTFENIQTILAAGLSISDQATYNDADAIRTYGEPGGAERLHVHVSDCVFRNVSKRAFKFRAAGAVAHDCEIYATGMQYGMIVPIDVTSNSKVYNIKIFASESKPVQSGVHWSVWPDTTQHETVVEGLYIEHCIVGVCFFSDPTNQPLKNFVLRNAFIDQATNYGISQASPLPSSMENIVIENVQIHGKGNVCTGIELLGSSDVSCGAKIKDVYILNGSFIVAGTNNDIENVQIEIDSSSYAGGTDSQSLFRIGNSGYGGYQNVKNFFVNAWNLNTSFLDAYRLNLGNFIGDNAIWKNIRIKVPDGLTTSFSHGEFYGNDWVVDGFTYDGPGYLYVGTSAASVRWAMKNCVRLGSGSSIREFLYTANAGTGNGLFENITDFRPTTNQSITIDNGLGAGSRFIVTNVASKTSNANVVQHGGLATVVNAIKFP